MFLITFLLSLLIAMHYYQWAMIVAAVLSILVIFSLLVMAVFSFVCWIRDNIREAKRIVEAEERRKSIIDSTND